MTLRENMRQRRIALRREMREIDKAKEHHMTHVFETAMTKIKAEFGVTDDRDSVGKLPMHVRNAMLNLMLPHCDDQKRFNERKAECEDEIYKLFLLHQSTLSDADITIALISNAGLVKTRKGYVVDYNYFNGNETTSPDQAEG